MSNPLYLPLTNQSKTKPSKRKQKSWKGVTIIRKSARLNKNKVPLVIKTKLSDEESYHGDSEDNDNLNEAYTKTIDDESYHGDSKDNENPEEEILGNIDFPLNNEKQLMLYCYEKSNDSNLTEDKLRLAQRFIRCLRTFYEFSRDITISNSVNAIYDFMTTNNCRLPIGASLFKKAFEIRVPPYQYMITSGLSR